MDRRRFLAVQGLAAASLVGGLSSRFAFAAAGTAVTIAESEGHSWAVPFVADAESLWSRHGLNVTTTHFTSGRLTAEAVLAGKADFATTTDSVVALAALQGHKPVVFAEFANSSTQMLVAARKDKGVLKPADLRGKRIGTFFGSAGHFYLNQYLKLHGLTPKDVSIINLRPQDHGHRVGPRQYRCHLTGTVGGRCSRQTRRQRQCACTEHGRYREGIYQPLPVDYQ